MFKVFKVCPRGVQGAFKECSRSVQGVFKVFKNVNVFTITVHTLQNYLGRGPKRAGALRSSRPDLRTGLAESIRSFELFAP